MKSGSGGWPKVAERLAECNGARRVVADCKVDLGEIAAFCLDFVWPCLCFALVEVEEGFTV